MTVDLAMLRKAVRPDVRARAAVELRVAARMVDPRERMDPDFLIVGAQKAGSSSLFAYAASHPEVDSPQIKEIRYFSRNYRRGMTWYRRNFPRRTSSDRLTGEADPFYLYYPRALERIALDLPQAKVVAILRDPLARMVSGYRHSVRLGDEDLSLTDALAAEEDRLAIDRAALERDAFVPAYHLQRHSYLDRSLYAAQVERVQRLFPGRCLFLRLEDLDDREALRPFTDFLGLRFRPDLELLTQNSNPGRRSAYRDLVPPAVVDRLEDDARRTADLLGWDYWSLS